MYAWVPEASVSSLALRCQSKAKDRELTLPARLKGNSEATAANLIIGSADDPPQVRLSGHQSRCKASVGPG
ncbi:hypothetical protein Sinac_3609 [Singulisphaera acidiphila DSM 18658]|uniref:Uncharacterized protein n=1 Tax=Singulisphaera acidiphila (strain ATCC BAA-1392 / DSM 18658 / VKM B-2454 / MOB10) TaxID=886293 RepID=L0DES4_SINAD|nr:hypothetical protein Sinac_3609 [Singulisphaera acidiphila DSM 18658]